MVRKNKITLPSNKHQYIASGATSFPDKRVVLDFRFYNEKLCEIDGITEKSIAKKFLKVLRDIGLCSDGQELQTVLKGHKSMPIKHEGVYKKLYSTLIEDLELYELWHKTHTPERFFYTKTGQIVYPVAFLFRHL
jgi:hypothetical protein